MSTRKNLWFTLSPSDKYFALTKMSNKLFRCKWCKRNPQRRFECFEWNVPSIVSLWVIFSGNSLVLYCTNRVRMCAIKCYAIAECVKSHNHKGFPRGNFYYRISINLSILHWDVVKYHRTFTIYIYIYIWRCYIWVTAQRRLWCPTISSAAPTVWMVSLTSLVLLWHNGGTSDVTRSVERAVAVHRWRCYLWSLWSRSSQRPDPIHKAEDWLTFSVARTQTSWSYELCCL